MSEVHTLQRPTQLAQLKPAVQHAEHIVVPAAGGARETADISAISGAGAAQIQVQGQDKVQGEGQDKGAPWQEIKVELEANAANPAAYAASIEVEKEADASILVRYHASSDDLKANDRETAEKLDLGLVSTNLDIHVGPKAQLNLVVLSNLPRRYFREAFYHAKLDAGARLSWTIVNLDRCDGIYTTTVDLDGEHSQLDLAGAYAATRTTSQEHATTIHHYAPFTKSATGFKSALKDKSRLIFRGLIHVHPEAHGTDAYLSSRNLLLEDGARAESLPQLKIENNDVACSHGATTGGVSEDELFYLESRGLAEIEAKNLLVQGHMHTVLARLPEELENEAEDDFSRLLGIGENPVGGLQSGATKAYEDGGSVTL
ncbi:MAG TPA: SufD family Fe-S cluster assembly protein [Spirochaetales bacterium]|nr:SufD family Fe-S cluster assembly protein [Spirochaetales bacterium]